jgi:hypothetical protein
MRLLHLRSNKNITKENWQWFFYVGEVDSCLCSNAFLGFFLGGICSDFILAFLLGP